MKKNQTAQLFRKNIIVQVITIDVATKTVISLEIKITNINKLFPTQNRHLVEEQVTPDVVGVCGM